MVTIDLPAEFDETFISLIPQQRATVHELMEIGTIVSYALSGDRSRLWIIVNARTSQEVKQILRTFPIHQYIQGEIALLAFHEYIGSKMPELSMN